MLTVAILFGVFMFVGSEGGFSPSMFVITLPAVLTGFFAYLVNWQMTRKAQAKHVADEVQREKDFRAYLADKEEQLKRVGQQQGRILWEQNPSVNEMVKRVEKQHHLLWERLPYDDDFLAVRLGTAATPLSAPIKVPPLEEDDPLHRQIRQLVQQVSQIPDAPFTTNINTLGTIGLRGRQRDTTCQVAYTMLAHLVTHHSPDTVQIYLISHQPDAPRRWEWLRWLPHTGVLHNPHADSPRISYMPETDDDVLIPLGKTLERRLNVPYRAGFQYGEPEPHLLIIFDHVADWRRHQAVGILLGHKPGREENQLHASALFIGVTPPQVNAQIEMGDVSLEYRERWMADANQVVVPCKAELTSAEQMAHLARRLAPLRLEGGYKSTPGSLPGSVRLVELLGATTPLEVNLDLLYSERYDPQKIMSFPIGINSDARPQMVVLREGPQGGNGHHALLAGATGKGKSVTLLSIVLSLAATNSPSHLNFVLADFKGGASELARLRQLPHVVGFVTDLDEAYVERFRQSLEGEIERRKRIFESTPQLLGRQIQNIYEYNKASPENLLPHLVVVIDEFARASQVNPEFKKTVETNIARQGRALGIHLILSSQTAVDFMSVRPNIDVRMSMQLQTAEESRAIFNRDDAAKKLTRAGQAYIQVGDNQIFEMFQVARADTPFREEGANLDLLDDFTIRLFRPDGRMESLYHHQAAAPANGQASSSYHNSQMSEAEVLVEHIRLHCESKLFKPARPICLDPLPEPDKMPLGHLLREEPVFCLWQPEVGWERARQLPARRLIVPLGMLDLPAQQEQRPYLLDLTQRDGHFVIVGPPGSGKSMCLRTAVLSLAATHSPADLLFFFVGRGPTLAIFEELPHCQALVQANETERLSRLFGFLSQEESQRSQRLRENRADNMTILRAQLGDVPMPSLVLVFDDFAGFMAEHYQHAEVIDRLIAKGQQTDIHLLFAVSTFRGAHARNLQGVLTRLVLGVKHGGDTMEILGKRSKPLPDIPGRGYVSQEGELLECQLAAPARLPIVTTKSTLSAAMLLANATDEIQEWVAQMKQSWSWADGDRPLPAITELPTYLELPALWKRYPTAPGALGEVYTAAMGLDYDALEPVRFYFGPMQLYNLVLGPSQSGKTDFLLNLCLSTAASLTTTQIEIVVISLKQSSTLRLLNGLPHVQFAGTHSSAKKLLGELQAILKNRVADQKAFDDITYSGRSEITRTFPKRTLILIDDVQQFSHYDDLNPLLDRCLEYGRDLEIRLFVADTSLNINQARQNFQLKYIQNACKFGSGVTFSLDANDLTLLNLTGKLTNPTLAYHRSLMGRGRAVLAADGRAHIVQFGRVGPKQQSPAQYENNLRELVRTIAEPYGAPGTAVEV
jgi:S-DNA-T family DNA segregation ATPase FtsK/SpoIIIE